MATKKPTAMGIMAHPSKAQNVISNCLFTGVKFDGEAIESITILAQALLENAKALSTLAYVFRATGVNIESLLRVGDTPAQKKPRPHERKG